MADKDAVSPFDNASVFPLYLYPNGNLPDDDLFVHDKVEKELRCPNFSPSFVKDICARLGVTFVSEGLGKISKKQVGPELIFNYAYAVFHSPGYRERYADFLRADFPRLPITCDGNLFARLAELGGRLVDLHARGKGDGSASSFPIKGNNVVEKVCYELRSGEIQDQAGRVWVNEKQYFEGIPETVWRFPIGGYRPAERWLKDRVGRTLSFDDLAGYSRLVAVLSETQLLMLEIDAVIEKYGGWPKAFV
jgi:predicted helicase